MRTQAGGLEFGGNRALLFDRAGITGIVRQQHRNLAPAAFSILSAITISAAEFEQAGEAVTQMNRAVRHRDDDDEVVSFRGFGFKQRFQPSPGRLIRSQQIVVKTAIPQRRLETRNDRALGDNLFARISEPTGRQGRHSCRAEFQSG